MLRRALLTVCFGLVGAAPHAVRIAAQTGPEPTIVLTAHAGVAVGHHLWTVDRQPLCQLTGGGGGVFNCSGQYDTLGVARDLGSSISVGLAMMYFPSSALGLHADLAYLGLPLDNHCTPINVADANNRQVCSSISSTGVGGSAVSFDVGVIARAAPRSNHMTAYARAGIGLLTYSQSTVQLVGTFVQGSSIYTRTVINDDHHGQASAGLTLGVGMMVPLGPGYLFRLEAGDVYARLKRVVGQADGLGVAPTDSRYYHHVALSIGLGVVLENRRGRRY